MAKRYGKDFDNSHSSPAKRAKIDGTREVIVPKERRKSVAGGAKSTSEDVWGDDFDDDAIEELDFVASQACSQDVNVSTDSVALNDASRIPKATHNFQPVASTSRALGSSSVVRFSQVFTSNEGQKSASGRKKHSVSRSERLPSQRLASSDNLREFMEEEHSMVFNEFKTNLLGRGQLNSTFHPRNDVVIISDDENDAHLKKIAKLEQENKKLFDDFMTKEGETRFLRNQLQQNLLREEKEKAEKARLMEAQASQYRSEIKDLHKENENLKNQFDFQGLQLGGLMERCKLLETGTVKLTTPQKAVIANDSPNRSRLNRSILPKQVNVAETSAQTCDFSKACWDLKTVIRIHPLDTIPQSIFEPPQPEKSVVDIQIVEKFGKKNLPILQEEDTFRIFENPDLVKPLVSMVDGRRLDTNYFMPEVAVLMKMTSTEINSKDCIPIVNKIVSTTRELLLNSTVVLQTIFSAMKNDDIRDMNDLYFSEFYKTKIDYDRTICDSTVWYDKERGVESRRAMGTMSYIAEESDYLSEYISGKRQLIVVGDEKYSNYDRQMLRYKKWQKKGHQFELLEMILEFVTALGVVRRSHQFTGLICAIARTLSSVHNKVGFCPTGMQYAAKIFKELVFSRPLIHCFIAMTQMLEVLCKSTIFGQKLCTSTPNTTSLSSWKGELHFTQDACTLEIYMAQLERFSLDPLTTVDISHALLSFVHLVFLSNSIPWTIESSNTCGCCTRILTYTITSLLDCSKIDVEALEKQTNALVEKSAKYDDNFWRRVKLKQLNVLRKGIRFLVYLAKRDPDFIMRASENSFHLFMQRIDSFSGLITHENEKEALTLIRSTLMFDKSLSTESRSQERPKFFRIRSAFEPKTAPSPTSGTFYDANKKRSSQLSVAMYRDLLND